MDVSTNQDRSARGASLRKRLRLLGLFILIEGLLAASVIFYRAVPTEPTLEGDLDLWMKSSKKYRAGMQVMGGEANLVAAEFREWFGSLWHGRRLAYTLGVVSVVGCFGCFYLGDFLTDPLPAEYPTEEKKRVMRD